jgi:hypothetical protein
MPRHAGVKTLFIYFTGSPRGHLTVSLRAASLRTLRRGNDLRLVEAFTEWAPVFDRIAIELCNLSPRQYRPLRGHRNGPGRADRQNNHLRKTRAEAISNDDKLSNVWTELEAQSPRSIRAIQMEIAAEQRGTPVETALV